MTSTDHRVRTNWRRCRRCVMDSTVDDISFNDEGICGYCTEFLTRYHEEIDRLQRNHKLDHLINEIKTKGEKRKYDCIVGLSGGVDSSWTLVRAVQLGLRPLAVHMDNGWNSELAQANIANLVQSLGVDLFTHVIDWEEYRQLMQAFLDSDVVDVELLYDNAMIAVNYRAAMENGVKYILAGTNSATEGMKMPASWNHLKHDGKNIRSIARSSNVKSFTTFPLMTVWRLLAYKSLKRIKWISFLDYGEYNKEAAISELQSNFLFKKYKYKHYESVFTRFYQGYLLPRKFGIDKRINHLSTLICTGQMDRKQAEEILSEDPYPDEVQLNSDITYFCKKMEWSGAMLEQYLSRPARSHFLYESDRNLWNTFKRTASLLNWVR